MTSESDIYFMKLALEEAMLAFDKGEVPVGAVLVREGNVIAKAHNTRETSNDPAGHAETLALRAGAQAIDNWRLTDAVLYVTKEPCIMCAGTMVNSRLGRLVYGCKDEKGKADILLTTDDAFLRKASQCKETLKVRIENPVRWLMEVIEK
jgi:tRNA(adenine34) deaminase